MKKLKLNGRLSLNKETVSKLNQDEMANVKAGGFLSIGKKCTKTVNGCPIKNSSFCVVGP